MVQWILGRKVWIVLLGGALTALFLLQPETQFRHRDTGALRQAHGSSETAQATRQLDPHLSDLQEAHQAVLEGDLATAERLFQRVQESAFPWHAWAATSGMVASYRMLGEYERAREVTVEISNDRPRLRLLMGIWDGDTAVLQGDFAAAKSLYSAARAADPAEIRALALSQLTRLAVLEGRLWEAAALRRELLRLANGTIDPELLLAEAMAYEAMAAGQLPPIPLSVLLHEQEACSSSHPCLLGREEDRSDPARAMRLAQLTGVLFEPSNSDLELLRLARGGFVEPSRDIRGLSPICTPSVASDGFRSPLEGSVAEAVGDPHPGADLVVPGSTSRDCPGDCGAVFFAAARGCVLDASLSVWGSVAIEHHYLPGRWVTQYGQASTIFYSAGAAISRGANLGRVGTSGTLHHELREEDHPYRGVADYYSALDPRAQVNWHQSPEEFHRAHSGYSWAQWADEGAFKRFGAWNYLGGPGDQGDLRWAPTTSLGTESSRALLELEVTRGGRHSLWVYVPRMSRASKNVRYRVLDGSGLEVFSEKVLDQSQLPNTWVKVEEPIFDRAGRYVLEIGSGTGEVGRRVGLDSVLLTRTHDTPWPRIPE